MGNKYMSKTYYRVSNQWTKILEPSDKEHYILNSSGESVQIQLTDQATEDNVLDTSHPFTIGGLISQLHVPTNQYLYAKVVSDNADTAILTSGYEPISKDEQEEIKASINALGIELMKLSSRVTKGHIKDIHHTIDYKLFLREFLQTSYDTHTQLAALFKHVTGLNFRLFAAERFMRDFRQQFANLEMRLDEFGDFKKFKQKVENIDITLGSMVATVNNINQKLNDLIPKIEEGWQDYDALVKEHINPLKDKVDDLLNDFTDLNNAMSTFVEENSPMDIENAFTEFIKNVDYNMVRPITALKNFLVDLAWKVDYRHTLDINAELPEYLEDLDATVEHE